MGKSESDIKGYEFGRFRIDLQSRVLTRDGQQVLIRPRLFDLLLILVREQGNVVKKEEIMGQLWGEVAIEESNVAQSVYSLRQIIDEPGQPESHILTFPKVGYVFTAAVMPIITEPPLTLEEIDRKGIEPVKNSGGESRFRIPVRRLTRLTIAGTLLIGIALFLGAYLIYGSSIRSLTIISRSAIPSRQLDPEFSPDGRYLAFCSLGETESNEDIYLQTTDQSQRIRLTSHPDADRNPVWSPDSKRVAFLRWSSDDRHTAKVFTIDIGGGAEEEIGRSQGALGWMPDGQHLVFNGIDTNRPESTVLFLVSLDGKERRQLTTSLTPGTIDTMPRPARSLQAIAFLRMTSSSRGDINLLDIPSGSVTQVTQEDALISYFQWGYREGGFYFVAKSVDGSRLWYLGLPGLVSELYGYDSRSRLVEQIPYELNQFSILAKTPVLAFAKQVYGNQVRLVEMTGQNLTSGPRSCLLPEASSSEPPQFSPTTALVAYPGTEGDEKVIWLAGTDCRRRVNFRTSGSGELSHLRWSPDGTCLLFEQQVDGQTEIWRIQSDGTRLVRLTKNAFDDLDPSWSADGRSVYYVGKEDGREGIRRLQADGGEPVTIVYGRGSEPVESADGRSLYFVRDGALFVNPLTTTNGEARQLSSMIALKEQQDGRHWQLGSNGVSLIDDTEDASIVIKHLDLPSGKIAGKMQIGGFNPSTVSRISISSNKQFTSLVLSVGSICELNLVKGWRLNPFTDTIVDNLLPDWVIYPNRRLSRFGE